MFAFTGTLLIIIGLTIVLLHPRWTFDWRSLITSIGYISIIQGVNRLAFPISARQTILKFLEKGYWFWLVFAGFLGIILRYKGFTQ